MYIGTQHLSGANWAQYRALAQLGVTHVSANPPGPWQSWTAASLSEFKEQLAECGVALDMIMLPLGSAAAPRNEAPHVFLGPAAERDQELDQICALIGHLGQAGIPAARYNCAFLGHFRTTERLGRGGERLQSFEYAKFGSVAGLDPLNSDEAAMQFVAAQGPLGADECWERIDHFLSRVVPVAEEFQVRLACHPEDPGLGERTHYGVARVLGTVDGLKRFISLHESPYHGLNFCVGTVSEMLANPAEEIFEIIRYFGTRRKLFNLHLRNIRGSLDDFVEVFPDEGDVNLRDVLRVLQEVNYEYMIMPDHVPMIAGEAPVHVGFAFCFGYIRALLQTLGIHEGPPPLGWR
jgi:mannonate dehydratase